MVPIAIKSGKDFDEEEFNEYFLKLCKRQKEQNRALAFAFLVYDFDDQAINQVLKNKDYWSSLDIISGKFLSVFYINSNDTYYKTRQVQIYNDEKAQRKNNNPKIPFSFLVPIKLRPTPLDNAISFIKKEFDIDDNLNTPFVIFFQTDGEGISDYFFVILKQEKLEEAFFELRDHLKNAVDSVSEVKPQYFKNHQEIFDLIRTGVESGRFYDFVKKKIVPKLGIGSIISLIKLLAGVGL